MSLSVSIRVATICCVALAIVGLIAAQHQGAPDKLNKNSVSAIPNNPGQHNSSSNWSGPFVLASIPPSSSSSAASGLPVPVPSGVTLQPIDGGPGYFSKWPNSFPDNSNFVPIGVFPAENAPASLASAGINFFTPMRNDSAGTWCPVWSGPSGHDMDSVNAQQGFYAGAAFYQTMNARSWGSRAAFNVFGDELDGNGSNWFDCLPGNITDNNQTGSWGGLTASAFEAAEAASRSDDPSRPTYIQTTIGFMDGGANYYYTLSQKRVICSGTDIFSFDIYPIVIRGGNVWDMYSQVKEARGYCQDSRPVFAFVEMDHMDNGAIYPMPAQTTAEVWNAIMAGARGVQYFDQYGNIPEGSYSGNGSYPAGAMYDAIKNTDAEVASLAPIINDDFANGYVTATGDIATMAKYSGGHFYIFAAPTANGSQSATFTLAGASNTTARLIYDSTSSMYASSASLKELNSLTHPNKIITVANGHFSANFSDTNEVQIYEIN
jgi:hypothetical protein